MYLPFPKRPEGVVPFDANYRYCNLFAVMIIVIIIIALGNSRNSTSSFNPQLGVQEQR